MDFRLGLGKERWTASVFGTTLTNKHAGLPSTIRYSLGSSDDHARSTNQPRTIGLGFETKF